MAKLVLVVDDDDDIREMLGDVLGAAGFGVRFASDAPEAQKILRAERPAILLTDWLMPEGGAALVASPEAQGIPVIVMTAATYAADDPQFGGLPVVRKPFDTAELIAVIRAHAR